MADPFVGEIRMFPYGTVPKGWLPCNGQTLQVAQYQALNSVIGNQFGGDGVQTFRLPDLQGRVPIHAAAGTPGAAGGEETHTLTAAEIPAHNHQVYASTAKANLPSPIGNVWAVPSGGSLYSNQSNTTMHANALSTAGESKPHNNMQPYLTFQFCIAADGIYPPKP
ncbi:phage tail protein [Paenibacillus sp.]|uniref:phage tail protein n=1 Tax=Paenibacillus sp. TaxID=58172 RepID=UPI002D3C566F|nr:tail fiber protein [Paenibacillus sp.]HZG56203.1 tail fiber protein [Paenibacillus sp.]